MPPASSSLVVWGIAICFISSFAIKYTTADRFLSNTASHVILRNLSYRQFSDSLEEVINTCGFDYYAVTRNYTMGHMLRQMLHPDPLKRLRIGNLVNILDIDYSVYDVSMD
jgi:hypothetical protein